MDRYVVYGNPISHSWSPVIHQEFARQAGLKIVYDKYLVESDFPNTVRSFFADGGRGANVTMPFKEDALRTAEILTDRAKMAGAVNTLYLQDGKLAGDNTDGQGFISDLERQYPRIKNAKVLLIGAGGATRGVVSPLCDVGVTSITIANRTEVKAQKLVSEFAQLGKLTAVSFPDLLDKAFDIVVNCTSSSVHGELPNISDTILTNASFVYDMYYQKEPTVFMRFAMQTNSNINVSDGLGMLVGQAAESFRLWTGFAPDIDSTIQYVKKQMFG